MKIVAIDLYPLVLPVKEIYGGAAGFLEDCRTLIVRVETDKAIEGWGEATQGRPGNSYETLETMDIMVRRYFAPALVGIDLEDIGDVVTRLHKIRIGHPCAKAALEIALYDALAKSYSLPLYRLLGGPFRKKIELVGGLGLDLTAETIGAKAKQLKQAGYRAFKIKIGQKDLAKDIARVRAVRQAVGEEATIRVDGNAAYTYADAREILNALGEFHLSDAEQPLARGDLKSLADLRRNVTVPIAVQESVSSSADALAALEAGAADLLKLKLTHIGGLQNALQVAAVVGAKNLAVVIGQGSACTPILSAAEMHLHSALRNAQPAGEMTGFLRVGEQEIFSPIEVTFGVAILSEAAGLGIEVNQKKLVQLARLPR
jgi:muconate cycloisomerase